MNIERKIAESRARKSAAEHRAWCELWIQAFTEDRQAARTDADLARLARSVHLLRAEIER